MSSTCCCQDEHLTTRELNMIAHVAAGLSNSQIGRCLGLSPHTVASHVATAMRRLGAANRAELVARAYVSDLLDATAWPPTPTGRRCVRIELLATMGLTISAGSR